MAPFRSQAPQRPVQLPDYYPSTQTSSRLTHPLVFDFTNCRSSLRAFVITPTIAAGTDPACTLSSIHRLEKRDLNVTVDLRLLILLFRNVIGVLQETFTLTLG